MDAKRTSAERAFVSASYLPDSESRLVPRAVARCPRSDEGISFCRVVSKGWRTRKTGPFLLLKRLLCLVHGLGFTVYPFGMVPFSRCSFLHAPNFMQSIEDACKGERWPDFASGQPATFKTQKRQILSWCKLLGVDASLSQADQLAAALTLGIPTISLLDEATKAREGPTYRGRAQVVMNILKRLGGALSFGKLLRRGHALKLWGRCLIDERDLLPHLYFTIND